jgi:hypothetical protein
MFAIIIAPSHTHRAERDKLKSGHSKWVHGLSTTGSEGIHVVPAD